MLACGTVLLVTGCTSEFGPLPDKAAAMKAGCIAMHERFVNGDFKRYAAFQYERYVNDRVECSCLEASLRGDVWTVGAGCLPKGYSGGGQIVELSKTDGRVLNFYQTG